MNKPILTLGICRRDKVPSIEQILREQEEIFSSENVKLYNAHDYFEALNKYIILVKDAYYWEIHDDEERWTH